VANLTKNTFKPFFYRYLSENELLDGGQVQLPPATSSAHQPPPPPPPHHGTSATDGSPQRSYYVWKEPPATLPPAFDQYGNQIQVSASAAAAAAASAQQQQQQLQMSSGGDTTSPPRHSSYASQVGYYLQTQQTPV
jgi:hypothetical protein